MAEWETRSVGCDSPDDAGRVTYFTPATSEATAAETSAAKKATKYVTLPYTYAFQPVAL